MRGFTLVELLVVMAISALLVGGAVVSWGNLRAGSGLAAAADSVRATLEQARLQALARQDDAGWGVKVDTNSVTLFKGPIFAAGEAANRIVNLPAGVKIQTISLENGGSEVLFDGLTGTTTPGSVVVAAGDEPSQQKTIYIARSGVVTLSASVAVAKSLTDSRHLHFDLGWSIQSSSQIVFRFSSPDDTRTVLMSPYFNADKTSWDYTGTFSVGGQTQKIRVHTHSLSPSSTLLSVERNRMNNTVALEILIDSKSIVSYTSDGTATKGAFGGEMTAP